MAHCEFCGTKIELLPFKCKYCGGTYCKNHRLPENHECTFESKPIPIVPTTTRRKVDAQPLESKGRLSPASEFDSPKKLKKHLKKQDKYRAKANKIYARSVKARSFEGNQTPATSFIVLAVIILSIVAVFAPLYLNFSLYGISQFYIWTIFTSMFVSYTSDYFGLIFVIFTIFIFSNIARNIELRFGTRFFMSLYLLSTITSIFIYILIRYPLIMLYPIELYALPVGFAMSGLLGIIAYVIFLNPDREMLLLCLFIPVKMKARLILLLLVLPYILLGLIGGFTYSYLYFAIYFPELGGVLAAYIMYLMRERKR